MRCPLVYPTPPEWAVSALADRDALLVDHAHCEHKAAGSALRLISRYPDHTPLIRPLLAIVSEEMRHFRQVLDVLDRRGVTLTRPGPDRYVNELRRRCTSEGRGIGGLGDQLLVAALIEARSCERFQLLAAALAASAGEQDRRLGRFYSRLATAEARHWETFRDLAAGTVEAGRLERRLLRLAAIEGEIVAALPQRSRIH